MMDVYAGNLVTDKIGPVTVQLPDCFEALNPDFRFQLTSIGQSPGHGGERGPEPSIHDQSEQAWREGIVASDRDSARTPAQFFVANTLRSFCESGSAHLFCAVLLSICGSTCSTPVTLVKFAVLASAKATFRDLARSHPAFGA
jgi:hypothetical protein